MVRTCLNCANGDWNISDAACQFCVHKDRWRERKEYRRPKPVTEGELRKRESLTRMILGGYYLNLKSHTIIT